MTASSVPASKPAIAAATKNCAPVLEVSTIYIYIMTVSSYCLVIRQLSGSRQAVVRKTSCSCHAVVMQLSGSRHAGNRQAVARQLSGRRHAVVMQSSCSRQAVVR